MKVMLVSVGGSTAPIIFSIRQADPDRLIFFVSKGSREKLPEILQAFAGEKPALLNHETVLTVDEQDVGESVKELLISVPIAMKKLGITDRMWPDIVDYTGGTKTMSAALVWASSKFPTHLSYVGTQYKDGRTKDGLGIVLDNRESLYIQENPWNKMSYFDLLDGMRLFNRSLFSNSFEILKAASEKTDDPEFKRILEVLADIMNALHCWDIFDHKKAAHLIVKNLQPMKDLSDTPRPYLPPLKPFFDKIQELHPFLNEITKEQLSWNSIHDLLANALRRAEIENKYEDAVARVYAAFEKLAKYQLKKTYGIDNSAASPEQIPESLRQDFMKKYLFSKIAKDKSSSECLRFPLQASFAVLKELGDPFGIRFFEREKDITAHLEARNSSILAHGCTPVDKEKFRLLFDDIMTVLKIGREELPSFPHFEI